ncbi:MAG: hypothetical protein J7K54_04995 [Candidatus Aenigmarchaeota archaeon]|nr:hypothetical protein [Candidatus Aenigmarchaeota archaeon]
MEGYSEQYRETEEVVDCPFCKKGKINVTYVHPYVSWNVSRIAAGAKRTRFYHDEKYKVHNKCPVCGRSRQEIREALESGTTKSVSHEERLKRLREAGLPTRIEVVHTRED